MKRKEQGLSQKQLGEQLFVNHSTIARWESGTRLPEVTMIPRIARCLGIGANTLFDLVEESAESPNIIMVDDNEIILSHGLSVLGEVMPDATITGFTQPAEAVAYAKMHLVSLAVLDIELGTASGIELCRTLLDINPCTNAVFLTAYPDYSLDAWETEATGFMLKPLTTEGVKAQLKKLRHPLQVTAAGGEPQ